jgi:methyl-accepting chemotaxis protein
MDQMTQQNAAMVEESTAASHSLAQEAEKLTSLIGQFKVDEKVATGVQARNSGAALRKPTPAPKPRQNAGRAVLKTVSQGSAATARKLEAAVEESWEEF